MSEELDPCPSCGALPCDWVNNPRAETPQSIPSEREAIVAWLREQSDDQGWEPPMRTILLFLAKAIERGGHLSTRPLEGEQESRATASRQPAGQASPEAPVSAGSSPSGDQQAQGDVPAIADQLTTLERELLSGKAAGWGSWMFECAGGLAKKGLAISEDGSFRWSPLGQRVANYLNRDG